MSWHEALHDLEDATARLAGVNIDHFDALAGILEARAGAVSRLSTPPAVLAASDGERLRTALDKGDVVLERLRLKRAATRSALARVNGEAYVLRRLGGADRAQVHFDLRA